jgi:hypothetical protein
MQAGRRAARLTGCLFDEVQATTPLPVARELHPAIHQTTMDGNPSSQHTCGGNKQRGTQTCRPGQAQAVTSSVRLLCSHEAILLVEVNVLRWVLSRAMPAFGLMDLASSVVFRARGLANPRQLGVVVRVQVCV